MSLGLKQNITCYFCGNRDKQISIDNVNRFINSNREDRIIRGVGSLGINALIKSFPDTPFIKFIIKVRFVKGSDERGADITRVIIDNDCAKNPRRRSKNCQLPDTINETPWNYADDRGFKRRREKRTFGVFIKQLGGSKARSLRKK